MLHTHYTHVYVGNVVPVCRARDTKLFTRRIFVTLCPKCSSWRCVRRLRRGAAYKSKLPHCGSSRFVTSPKCCGCTLVFGVRVCLRCAVSCRLCAEHNYSARARAHVSYDEKPHTMRLTSNPTSTFRESRAGKHTASKRAT